MGRIIREVEFVVPAHADDDESHMELGELRHFAINTLQFAPVTADICIERALYDGEFSTIMRARWEEET